MDSPAAASAAVAAELDKYNKNAALASRVFNMLCIVYFPICSALAASKTLGSARTGEFAAKRFAASTTYSQRLLVL